MLLLLLFRLKIAYRFWEFFGALEKYGTIFGYFVGYASKIAGYLGEILHGGVTSPFVSR